jgi:hypothetical protein
MTPEEFNEILTQHGLPKYIRAQKQILEKPKEGGSRERLEAVRRSQEARKDIQEILSNREICRQLLTYTRQQTPLEQTKIINLILVMMDLSGEIYGKVRYAPYYQDALQLNMIWFCENFVNGYNPDKSSVIYWFNQYQRYRILDLIKQQRPNVQSLDEPTGDPDIDIIPSPEPKDFIKKVEEMLESVENCPNLPNSQCPLFIIRKYPNADCRSVLISVLKLLHTGEKDTLGEVWKTLGGEYQIPSSSIKLFIRNECSKCINRLTE